MSMSFRYIIILFECDLPKYDSLKSQLLSDYDRFRIGCGNITAMRLVHLTGKCTLYTRGRHAPF